MVEEKQEVDDDDDNAVNAEKFRNSGVCHGARTNTVLVVTLVWVIVGVAMD